MLEETLKIIGLKGINQHQSYGRIPNELNARPCSLRLGVVGKTLGVFPGDTVGLLLKVRFKDQRHHLGCSFGRVLGVQIAGPPLTG